MDEGRNARKVLVLGGGNEEAGIARRNGAGNRQRNEEEEEEESCRSKLARGVRTRSSGGKDRHTKVITAKGLRDRRVRLSVSTAIQFYDVLDRLGYDQPSKAVEWLIKQAKCSIDELQELPSIPNCSAVVRRSEPTWSDKAFASLPQSKPHDFIPFSQIRSSDWNWSPPDPNQINHFSMHSSSKQPDCSMPVTSKPKEISSHFPPCLGTISSELNPPRFLPPAQNPRHHSGNNNNSSCNDASSAAAAPSFLELLSNESSLENLLHRSANNPHSHSHSHSHSNSHSHAQLLPARQQAFFGYTPLASVLIPPLQHAMHGYGGSYPPEAPYPIPSVGFSNLNPNSAPKLQPDPWVSRDSFQSFVPSADQQHPKLHSFVLGDSLQSIADPRVHPGSSSFYSLSNPDINSRGSK